MQKTIQILSANQIEKKIKRLAWQVYENNLDEKDIVIIGIADKGFIIAQKISEYLEEISSKHNILGKITLNKRNPSEDILFNLKESQIKNKVVILIDDVLNSGQTLMYAAKYLLGVPLNKLSTLVLINRQHNNYPIKVDFSGLSLSTTLQEYVKVDLSAENQGAYLC